MKFVVMFEDNLDADPDIRKTHMEAHLSFLENNGDVIDSAGPVSSLSGEPAGGVWIVDCESGEDVERLIHGDPFWPTGLRKSVTILKWRLVYADGRRQA
jgi:uncharacterized protein YciI